jgi:hypothetical protein
MEGAAGYGYGSVHISGAAGGVAAYGNVVRRAFAGKSFRSDRFYPPAIEQ